MNDDLMSCLTCLRVQREGEMLVVENPARDRASMSSFRLCMGCATAVATALDAYGGGKYVGLVEADSSQNDQAQPAIGGAGDTHDRGGEHSAPGEESGTAKIAREVVEAAAVREVSEPRKRK